jgi:hypothetical protein
MFKNTTAIAIMIISISLLVSGCGTGQLFGPALTPTKTPTLIPYVTEVTLAPTPTFTSVPSLTSTATPLPGPELLAYLPVAEDLPKCRWVQYSVSLTHSSLWCNLIGNASLSASLTVQGADFRQADLKLSNPVAVLSAPSLGQGSLAAQVDKDGRDIQLVFLKGNSRILVESSYPLGKANLDEAVALAQLVEKLIPDHIVPATVLSFPEHLDLQGFNKYFYGVDIKFVDYNTQQAQPDFTETSYISLTDVPRRVSRDFYVVGLYDLQTLTILSKTYNMMFGNTYGGGLEPNYPPGQFKKGDKYELRLAVGDALVAVFPFETK